MDRPSNHPHGVLLTSADLECWEAEARELDTKAQVFLARRDKLRQRIEVARGLASLLDDDDVKPSIDAPASGPLPEVKGAEEAEVFTLAGTVPPTRGIWKRVLREWIYTSPTGLSGTDIRSRVLADPDLGPKFKISDKGFYHALTRMQASGDAIKHLGRYYSPRSLEDHKRRVAAGEISEQVAPENGSYYSPMGEAIMDIVSKTPGISGADVVRCLRHDAEFNAALTPHSTGAFNVIARLAKRRQIDRIGGDCFPGPNMQPRDSGSKWLSPKESLLN